MPAEYSAQSAWRRIRSLISVPNPAAGADWSYSIPPSTIVHLFTITAQLVTSAVVANRTPVLSVSIGGVSIYTDPSEVTVTASSTRIYSYANGVNSLSAGNAARGGIPDLWLETGAVISVATGGIDAGDQWSAITLYAEVTTFKGGPINLLDVPAMTVVIANPGE